MSVITEIQCYKMYLDTYLTNSIVVMFNFEQEIAHLRGQYVTCHETRLIGWVNFPMEEGLCKI